MHHEINAFRFGVAALEESKTIHQYKQQAGYDTEQEQKRNPLQVVYLKRVIDGAPGRTRTCTPFGTRS